MSNDTIHRNLGVSASAPIAGIYDAQAFRVGNSETIHYPHHYPTTNMVVAYCGVYGYAVERESRIAEWAYDYPNCDRCKEICE